MAVYRYPQAGAGLYRIGGLLFEDGVAHADELSHADEEILSMLGIEADPEEPEKQPDEQNPVSDTDKAAAEAVAPQAPAPETPEQADAQQHEVVTVDSDSDGHATLDAGEHVEG